MVKIKGSAISWIIGILVLGVIIGIIAYLVSKKNYACEDTPDWSNGSGHDCESYEKQGWCKDGAAGQGQEWTLGKNYHFPEKNCCICGKAGPKKHCCSPTAANQSGCSGLKDETTCIKNGVILGCTWKSEACIHPTV